MIQSAYVHVPFCDAICAYCDFVRWRYQPSLVRQWLKRIREEAKEKLRDPLFTLYIGGGTPSALSVQELEQLLAVFDPWITSIQEYTVEANPESLTPEKIAVLKQHGVNRISMGVQSFQPDLLKRINRRHTAADVERCIGWLKQQAMDNISIDLLYALPKQTLAQWQADLAKAVQLPITHLSLYGLTIEEHSLFGKTGVQKAEDELEYEMYAYANAYLAKQGFTRYEVANFAKAGYSSKHNQVYWHYDWFHGIGCGASGMEPWGRYDNTRSLSQYLKEGSAPTRIPLTQSDQMFETLMMGLRLKEGVSLPRFQQRFHTDARTVYAKALQAHLGKDLFIVNDHLKTNEAGVARLHDILLDFMEEG